MGTEGVHQLLRGGQPPYPNKLSKRQMASLAAICDTFLPAMEVEQCGIGDAEALAEFFGTSASMLGVPEHIGGLHSGRTQHPSFGLLRFLLWVLSTRWGTALVGGRHSISNQFPYFQKFSSIKQRNREKILLSWCSSSILLNNMAFKCLKYTCMNVYFTKVDEKNHNPAWRAIDYCGPDPQLPPADDPHPRGQLLDHLVDANATDDAIIDAFTRAGFDVALPSSSSPFLTILCDAVVVGSGSGGSVVAGVLAGEGHRVVVVEKGRCFMRGELSLLEGPSVEEMYENYGCLTTDDVGAVLLAGSTVGGGSAVNWAAAIRTPAHVVEEWYSEHGLETFAGDGFGRALDVVCERLGVHSEVADEGFSSAVLRRGCEALKYPVSTVPRNVPSDHSCGWCNLGCRGGQKQCTRETWLADMARSGKGLILHSCRVSRVLKEKRSHSRRPVATGVLVQLGGSKRTAVIKSRVTIVAAGALNTPPLLRRSGLRNKHIGKHLHLHPSIMAWGYFPESSKWPEKQKKSYNGAILTAMSTVVANDDSTGYGAVIQNPALHPGTFSMLTPWLSPLDFRTRLLRFSRTAHLYALARDRGSGSVASYPKSLTYKPDRTDRENLRKGVEAALRILVAAGAEKIGTHDPSGKVLDVVHDGRDRVEEYVKEESVRAAMGTVCSAHQMGSCRMGRSKDEGAVGPTGETWEVEGLFVADTSVFPTAVGVNPMVTVQAVAYCTAKAVLESLSRRGSVNNR